MAKKNLILLNLEDSKINKIANVVSNDSCKKILDFLSDKEDSTESEIAKELSLPISTVHYNLKQLMDAGLVNVEEYTYSEKGREVNHYKLANKYIIIAPKGTKKQSLRQKLKNILPVGILAAATAGIIELVTRFTNSFQNKADSVFLAKNAPMPQAASYGAGITQEAAKTAGEEIQRKAAEEIISPSLSTLNDGAAALSAPANDQLVGGASAVIQNPPLWQNIALWFLIGAIFTIIIFLILSVIKKKND